MNGYAKILSERVYYPGDWIPWASFAEYRIKPRVRVKMGRA